MAVLICLMLPRQIAVPSLGPAVNTADLQVAKSRLWFDDLKLGITRFKPIYLLGDLGPSWFFLRFTDMADVVVAPNELLGVVLVHHLAVWASLAAVSTS